MFVRALVIGVIAAAIAAPTAWAKPSVTVVSAAPLQLRGVAFKPATMVTVAVTTTDGRLTKRILTSPSGRFTARFAVAAAACNGATAAMITTVSGYRLTLRLAPRGVCPPIQPIDQ